MNSHLLEVMLYYRNLESCQVKKIKGGNGSRISEGGSMKKDFKQRKIKKRIYLQMLLILKKHTIS